MGSSSLNTEKMVSPINNTLLYDFQFQNNIDLFAVFKKITKYI